MQRPGRFWERMNGSTPCFLATALKTLILFPAESIFYLRAPPIENLIALNLFILILLRRNAWTHPSSERILARPGGIMHRGLPKILWENSWGRRGIGRPAPSPIGPAARHSATGLESPWQFEKSPPSFVHLWQARCRSIVLRCAASIVNRPSSDAPVADSDQYR